MRTDPEKTTYFFRIRQFHARWGQGTAYGLSLNYLRYDGGCVILDICEFAFKRQYAATDTNIVVIFFAHRSVGRKFELSKRMLIQYR